MAGASFFLGFILDIHRRDTNIPKRDPAREDAMRRVVLAAVSLPASIRTAILALAICAASAHAIEMSMSHRGLVTDSDVIVIAILEGTHGEMKYGRYVEEGMLRIQRVVCGDVKTGEMLLLRWSNFPGVVCPRVAHGQHTNKSRLWFLKRDTDGTYLAGTDQRSWPADEVETFIDTLAAYPYHVITPRYNLGDRVVVTIEFRNATASPLSVPTIRVLEGRVTYSNGFALVLHPAYSMGEEKPLTLRPGALERNARLDRTTLAPGERYRADVSFSDIVLNASAGLYRFDVRVDGRMTTHGVRVQSEWETACDRVRDTPEEFPFYIRTLRAGGPRADDAIRMLEVKRTETSRFADELMSLCDSLDTQPRWQVMRLIRWLDVPTETQMDFFLACIGDAAPEVRACAAGGIGQLVQSGAYRRDDGVAFLLTLLDDEDPMTRHGAVGTISNARISEGLPSLRIIARYDPDEETRRSAWWAIDVLEGRRPCKDRKVDR